MVIISTPWQGATKIASAIVCQPEIQRVEQQMVRQIQAFHLSFDKDKTSLESEEQTTPEVSPRHNHETVIKSLPTSAKSHLPFSGTDSGVCVSEDSGDTFLRRMTVQADSVFIGKLVTSRTEREPMTPHDSKSQQEAGKAVRVSKSPSLTTCASTQPQLLNSSDGEWPSHSEVKAYWEGAAQGSMRLSGQRFEVLDASQLENTVLRREPAIVSQQGQGNRQSIAPYLFQPIQSHPVTKDKGKIETVVVSPTIRVEPKRTLTLEVQRDSSPTETVTEPPKLKSVMPWTIEIHSPIKLEPVAPTMPSPERLLPVGPMKVDGSFSTAETDRSCALTTCRPFFLEDESAPQTIRTQFPTTTTSVEHGSMKDQRQQSSTADKDSKPLFVKQMVQAENVLEHPEHKKDSFELTSVVVSNSTKFFEENKTGTDDSDRSTLEVIVVDKTTGHSSWKSNGSFDDDNHRPMTASCVRVSTDSLGIVQPDRVIIHEPVVVVPSAETPSVIHPSEISMVTPRVKTETHYDAAGRSPFKPQESILSKLL